MNPTLSPSLASYPTQNPTKTFPKILGSLRVSLQSTLVTVLANVSAPSILYCGAFGGQNGTLVNSTQISQQGYFASGNGPVLQVEIGNLVPLQYYSIYCYAKGLTSNIEMPLSLILATKTIIQTKCCKQVTVTYPLTHSNAIKTFVTGIQVSLSHYPSASLTVLFNITQYKGGSASSDTCLSDSVVGESAVSFATAYVTPNPTTFTLASPLSSSFAFYASTAGCYMMRPVFSGVSSSEYSVSYANLPSKLFISASAADLPAPVLQSATFSSDGRSVVILFDEDTDQAVTMLSGAQSFSCSALFVVAGGNDTTSTCLWYNLSSIIMTPSGSVNVGSSLVLKSNTIKASCPAIFSDQCNVMKYSPSQSLQITAPAYAIPPTIYISAPARIGMCSELALDVSSSLNSGGRVWKYVTVTLASTTDSNASSLIGLLAQLSQAKRTLITIPRWFMHAPNVYTFRLNVTNFLGASSSASFQATVESSQLPVVSIGGQTVINTIRSKRLTLTATASVKLCDGSFSSSGISYKWFVNKGTELVTLTSISKDPKTFIADAYTLQASSKYVFTAQTRWVGSVANYSVTVNVGQGGILAKIAGGNLQTVKQSGPITLDASSSVNYDVQTLAGSQAGLSFLWSCIQYSPRYGSACPHSESLKLTSSVVNVTGPFNVSAVYQFRCVVAYGSISSSASALVTVVVDSAPQITLASVSNVVLANKKLKLFASVTVGSGASTVWSMNGNSTALGMKASTAVRGHISSGVSTVSLVIPANSLTPGGQYVLTLTCTLDAQPSTGFASVTVNVNPNPTPGFFSVTPSTGTFLSTVFRFSTTFWTTAASSYPLSYAFGFVDDSGNSVALQGASASQSYAGYLPAGSVASAYSVLATTWIYDIYGSKSVSSVEVVVTEAAISLNSLQSSFESLFGESSSAGTSSAFQTAATLVSNYLNTVNCTGASALKCLSLNRQNCALRDHTCGPCLEGYAGMAGDDNSYCLSTGDLTSRKQVGSSCASNSDCTLSYCHEGYCAVPLKQCINNCSSNGTCVYLNVATKQEIAGECKLTDPSCKAKCDCNYGYAGSSCQYTTNEFEVFKSLRKKSLNALANSSSLVFGTEDGLSSLITTLTSVANNPDEVVALGKELGDGAQILALLCYYVGCSYDVTLKLFVATGNALEASDDEISAAVSTGRRLSSATSSAAGAQLSSSITNVAISIASDMTPDQSVVHSSQSSSQMSVYVSDLNTLLGRFLSPPLSSSDLLSGISAFAASLVNAESTYALPYMMLAAITFTDNPYGAASVPHNSTTRVHKVVVGPADGSNGYGVSRYDLRLVLPYTYSDGKHEYLNVLSQPMVKCYVGESGLKPFACPWGSYTVTCNGSSLSYHVNCTRSGTRQRYCGYFDGNSFTTNDSVCHLEATNRYNSTCKCTLKDISLRRVLSTHRLSRHLASSSALLSSDLGTIDVMGISEFTETNAYVIKAVYHSTIWQHVPVSYVTLIAYLIIIICSLCFILMYVRYIDSLEDTSLIAKKANEVEVRANAGTLDLVFVSEYLDLYIGELFSSIYSVDMPLATRFVYEISEHHKWLSVFLSQRSTMRMRLMAGLQLVTMMSLTMFVVEVSFGLQATEDSSCNHRYSLNECEGDKTLMSAAIPNCIWNDDPSDGVPRCSWKQPILTSQIFIIITVILLIVRGPVEALTDSLYIVACVSSGNLIDLSSKYSNSMVLKNANTLCNQILLENVDNTPIVDGTQSELAAANDLHFTGSDVKFGYLLDKLRDYRLKIADPEERMNFDVMWGLVDESGGTSPKNVVAIVKNEIYRTGSQAYVILNRFSKQNVPAQSKGYEILLQFLLDLLGRDSSEARMLRVQADCDLKPLVLYPWWSRVMAAVVLLLLNLFFLLYTIIVGSKRSFGFQGLWVIISVGQILVEVFVLETLVLIVQHFLFPSIHYRAFKAVLDVVRACIKDLCLTGLSSEYDKKLNSADYFFVSAYLSRAYPQLLESKIVQVYKSSNPGMIGKKWSQYRPGAPVTLENGNKWSFKRGNSNTEQGSIHSLMKSSALSWISFIGSMQKTLRRIIIMLLLAGLIVCLFLLFDKVNQLSWGPIFLGVVFGFIALLVITLIMLACLSNKKRSTSPRKRTSLELIAMRSPRKANESESSSVGNKIAFKPSGVQDRVSSSVNPLKSDTMYDDSVEHLDTNGRQKGTTTKGNRSSSHSNRSAWEGNTDDMDALESNMNAFSGAKNGSRV